MSRKEPGRQLPSKPLKLSRFERFNMPKKRKFGKSTKRCRKCGRAGLGVMAKYNLYYCRQCFREEARKLGFRKYE